MYVLAITGGIGAGKSTAARVFAEHGAVVIDADELAKSLLRPGSPVVEPIVEAFGETVRSRDGGIEPAALAEAAFASPEAAAKLNAIVHPAVYAALAGALDALAAQARPPRVVVIDIPLLYESPQFLDLFDAVLVISAADDVRAERLVARGMAADDVERRMACQASDAERRSIADYVIENDGDESSFREAVEEFFEREIAPRFS
ncbi:dephospho-CoA kinase [Coriobacteriia bacterium Es71-Z0120]|uniref:dephospho-CoA kinase n=1 Tax=Parvivirga hydrogeniphila TaxID=2939460 RepID=UPI002260D892|nr:dephospho-CoA kinase [Parvivirga hydrogeniphila]MCL4078859.1 dephospho-CoA kinase [Parvivirga hydrogeniphila]